jgi:regulator of PEP synthase PpsR (kinase-PPPase family)
VESERPAVFVLSDSLGETAELVVRAAAAQFNAGGVDVRRFGYIQSQEAIDMVLKEAQSRKSSPNSGNT